jgi:hypothetical protein
MPIEFSCQACGQAYSVKDEFAGRTTKCRKCSQPVTVPVPAAPDLEPLGALGSFLDEEIGPTQPKQPVAPVSGPTMPCPSCAAPMPQTAALCVKCGYDVATGKTRVTQRPDEAAQKKKKKREAGESSGMLLLARGIALSSVGALLGAVVWALVAVATHREIGWIAWAVGAAAGGGMSLGYDDKSDGTVPGILAAFIALGGIVMGKVFILVWVLYPLLTGNLEDFAFQREAVAGNMATKALEQRGVDPDADELAFQQEYDKSLRSLAAVSDEEIERRFTAMAEEAQADIELAAVEPEVAAQGNVQAVVINEGQPGVVLEPEPVGEEEPSLVGAFFSTMFGPMDALFILLAFFTAYKVGSGSMTG